MLPSGANHRSCHIQLPLTPLAACSPCKQAAWRSVSECPWSSDFSKDPFKVFNRRGLLQSAPFIASSPVNSKESWLHPNDLSPSKGTGKRRWQSSVTLSSTDVNGVSVTESIWPQSLNFTLRGFDQMLSKYTVQLVLPNAEQVAFKIL